MSDLNDIKRILSRLLDAGLKQQKDKGITTDSADAYLRELSDIPADLLDAACSMYISKNTWFPTPGDIRREASKLKMSFLRVPTGAEAWAQVLRAVQHKEATYCETGESLYLNIEGKSAGEYWKACWDYDDHKKSCVVCTDGGHVEVYDHPAVKETVRLFGGRDALFTEYRTADRARFIDAYKEVLERETERITMPDEVTLFLETETAKASQIDTRSEMKLLSERMGSR